MELINDDGNIVIANRYEDTGDRHPPLTSAIKPAVKKISPAFMDTEIYTMDPHSNMFNTVDLLKFRSNRHLVPYGSPGECTEVDAESRRFGNYKVGYYEIFSNILSIIMRAVSVYISISLAIDYWMKDEKVNFAWTTSWIVIPMFITVLIHANMCRQDGAFNKGTCKAVQTLWLVFISSFLFRYWTSLVFSVKCKYAERNGDLEKQMKYYKLMIREESDVAFIRLFECFLEASPQKVLQISIVLRHIDRITTLQIIAICSYVGSTAWCLTAYHRCSRFFQIDKSKMNIYGLISQICWHFCISASRTFCIALIACIFPLWSLLGCLSHAFFLGFITFIVDRPQFASTTFLNYIFCLVLGTVYLFTYFSSKDGPTRTKYSLYYLLCFFENIICLVVFWLYASSELAGLVYYYYALTGVAMSSYFIGIIFMIIYYVNYHPNITARASKFISNNN